MIREIMRLWFCYTVYFVKIIIVHLKEGVQKGIDEIYIVYYNSYSCIIHVHVSIAIIIVKVYLAFTISL